MNGQFENFLEGCATGKYRKQPILRLKVNGNNAIRSGSSLAAVTAAPTPCQKKEIAAVALKELVSLFKSSASATFV